MKLKGLIIALLFCTIMQGQEVLTQNIDYNIQNTTATKLGTSKKISNLIKKQSTSREKKDALKSIKSVPDNFRGRRSESKSVNPDKEHQGEDKLWQKENYSGIHKSRLSLELEVNVDGLYNNFGSPHDPSGDVSDKYYVQAINVTEIGVYDLKGNLIEEFAANTLWTEFNTDSAGDPIILYDEINNKWIVTEFADPALLLVAISTTEDPLGSYDVYSFATPDFPDYPKYAITPDAIVVTTNEINIGVLHQYFIDKDALMSGAENVTIQRIQVEGNRTVESQFHVTTPVDWNGTNMPYDNMPMTMRLNDSSWQGGPDEDQIELYSFDIDFDNSTNTVITQNSIIISPFDAYPCSDFTGGRFSCLPQLDGAGIEGLPEMIMNIPHHRNFDTHESIVFTFVTDVTDGQNLSGIRWVELRRSSGSEWSLYQEGTYAPDDGLDRFMPSIAIDDGGNIGLGYNVTGPDSYIGLRVTGRRANDPLGVMTIDETVAVDGITQVESNGRFGDYSQMSVSPLNDNTFWFTGEYAGNDDNNNSKTRIFSFKLQQDTFDLDMNAFIEPVTSSSLSNMETVIVEVINNGMMPIRNYDVRLDFNGTEIETINIPDTIFCGEIVESQFTTQLDMSSFQEYELQAISISDLDTNPENDTIRAIISKIRNIDGELTSAVFTQNCEATLDAEFTLINQGESEIQSIKVEVSSNGMIVDTISYSTNLEYTESTVFSYNVNDNLIVGNNEIVFSIVEINASLIDENSANDSITVTGDLKDNLEEFILRIRTDRFAQETSWNVREENSTQILFEAQLSQQASSMDLVFPLCLDPSLCYVLEVNDSYGDGICCGPPGGNGNFSVEDSNGEVLVSNNGQFGLQVLEMFCGSGCNLTAEVDITEASTGNSVDGVIMITAMNGVAPYSYSIDGGITFVSDNTFSDLPPGDYTVVVVDANADCEFVTEIEVRFSTSTSSILTDRISILPNPTDGVVEIKVPADNYTSPYMTVNVFDITGAFLHSRKIGRYDNEYTGIISLHSYASGHYLLRYVIEGYSGIARVIRL